MFASPAVTAALEALLNRVPLIVWATDDNLRLRWARGGAVRMLGLDELCRTGADLERVFGSPHHPILEQHRTALSGRSCSIDAAWLDRLYEIWIDPVFENNSITGSIAIAIDVTRSKRAEDSLLWQSGFDSVTGALNRSQLCEQLELRLAEARRRDDEISVAYVDLDGFTAINESCGTAVADRILRAAHDRIVRAVPERAIAARVGPDEFAVVLDGSGDALRDFCGDLQRSFGEPLVAAGRSTDLGVSIGTAAFPRDGASVERLLGCAAAAARHAAAMGGRQSNRFSAALENDNRQRVRIDGDLRDALRRNELFLVYQPQVRIDDGSLAGIEVLLRWRKNGEVIPAWTFIRQAEESSVIIPIGEWVIDTALAQLKAWRERGIDPGRLAINIGARQLADDSIVGTMRRALAKHGIPGAAVDIEITETAAMQNIATTARLLEDLRALGLEISIDDFGTGYSSLSYLRRFAVTGLKIDQSFVADLDESETATGIVKAIIATARVFGMRLVAEGVETQEQAALLRAHGCKEAQGFLYSPPLDAAAMTEYLGRGAAREHRD